MGFPRLIPSAMHLGHLVGRNSCSRGLLCRGPSPCWEMRQLISLVLRKGCTRESYAVCLAHKASGGMRLLSRDCSPSETSRLSHTFLEEAGVSLVLCLSSDIYNPLRLAIFFAEHAPSKVVTLLGEFLLHNTNSLEGLASWGLYIICQIPFGL